ncbi:MAG TPA: M56 family metallopeptidase, partial [Dongiaceae bacterium]|nr:M56 family metallopeptidase [Dongiaceae bacterium]
MNSPELSQAWLQLLLTLGLEAALVALVVVVMRRLKHAAAWGRRCCQAGLMAVLAITATELSGLGRGMAGWAVESLGQRGHHGQPVRHAAADSLAPAITDPNLRETRPEPRLGAMRAGSAATTRPATATETGDISDSHVALWLWLVWLLGMLVGLGHAGVGRVLASLFRWRRRSLADEVLVARVQALAKAMGMRRRVRVVQSARLTSPIAFGLFHPTVGLPVSFSTNFDARRQEAILAHEVAHLAAHDPFWCAVADLALALLWWHPAVWWLRRQLQADGELVADEASLLLADGPAALAECLVEFGARLSRQPFAGPLGVASFRSQLGRRVQRLMEMERCAWSPPTRFRAAVTGIFGALAMAAIAIVCTAWATPQASTRGQTMNTMKLNWKRSLATVAMLVTFNGPEAAGLAQPSGPPADGLEPATSNAALTTHPIPKADSPRPPDAFLQRYGLRSATAQDAGAQDAAKPLPEGLPAAEEKAPTAKRDGESEKGSALIEAKLKRLRLSEAAFDGLPLGEVLKILRDESTRLDPEKAGVNFLINPNFPPVAMVGHVDPATGLPLAVATEAFDMSTVMVKFNLPLRNVSLKDVLDAVGKVADHPIAYTVEDYAVVFSPKPLMLDGQPVMVSPGEPPATAGAQAVPGVGTRAHMNPVPEAILDPSGPVTPPLSYQWQFKAEGEPVTTSPHRFDLDFGPGRPSESAQVGRAAAGEAGDFWNTVAVSWNDDHTESGLRFATGEPSPIRVRMINLGGSWSNSGQLGVKSPMLDTFNYPAGNKGGDAKVVLEGVPPGKYQVFIYGHGADPLYYGDYTLTIGNRNYGRKSTFQASNAGQNTKWAEGSQY